MTYSISRRDLLRAAAALGGSAAAFSLLDACSNGQGSQPAKSSSGGPVVTIQHWDYWVSQAPYIENEIKLFEAANPGIKIKRTVNASTTYDQLFSLAQRSGNLPDTFVTALSIPLNDQAAKGWLHPLNQWATGSWQRQFPPYSFVEGSNTFAGKIYSAPFSGNSPFLQLYVNSKVFKDAGLTNRDGSVKVPKTWDDITRAADTIVKKSGGSVAGLGFGNGGGNILTFWLDLLVRAAGSPGGAVFAVGGQDLRTGRYSYSTDRNYADVIRLITGWRDKGYFYTTSTSISDEIARAYFERGRFGMTIGGVWLQPEFTQHRFTDYELTTLIGPEAQRKGYYYYAPGGAQWAMSATTAHPEESWQWINWLYSPAAGRRWTQMFNEDLSVFPQADDPGKIKFKPFSQFVGLKPLAIPGPSASLRNRDTAFVVLNPVQPNVDAVLTGIYTGQIKDVQSALTDLDARLDAALADGIKAAQQQGHKVNTDDYVFADWDITKPYRWSIPEYVS
ncbi:MAG: extracellular solute-binding protein [Chloroflexi bacterium]|nr:MAG: extracellular solute-binding protein [Chloroflexota bacterium]